MSNIGVVLHSSSLRRTDVRLTPRNLHALILNISQTRQVSSLIAKEVYIKMRQENNG